MRRFRPVLAIGLLMVSLQMMSPVKASAQMPGLGRINGVVVDESGAPIEGVQIQTKTVKGGAIEAKTDAKGNWIVPGLGRGTWEVDFAKEGFRGVKAKVTIETELRRTDNIKIVLKKA